jgi:hypothetical protein
VLTVCLTGGSNLTLDACANKYCNRYLTTLDARTSLAENNCLFEMIFVVNRTRHGYHSIKIGLFRWRCKQMLM